MKKTFALALIASLVTTTYADTIDANGTRWPIPSWSIAPDREARMDTEQCRGFIEFATKNKKFLTDGLVVIKDGQIQYESYDPKYTADTPHSMWSISKTVTGALLGIAVRDGKISLDQYLNDFYPRPDASENYQKIKIENLFYLDAGFIWDDVYSGKLKESTVIKMLFTEGLKDAVKFNLDQKIIPQGPGYKFNYSTGTPVITMGVLKEAYGEDYDEMPWKTLFNPLGMKKVSFERDPKGVFYGGSSIFTTPREMAKLGYLYLNRGKWNGEEILSEDWIQKTAQVSPGYLSKGTVIRDIHEDGVYGGSIWLNKEVRKDLGKPFPASPDDMLIAHGHYGQMLAILPSQNMVVVRNGYDLEYKSKIDQFISRSIACFSNPHQAIGKTLPPPKYAKPVTMPIIFQTTKSGLTTDIFLSSLARAVCSCHFISGLDEKTCIARSNIPFTSQLINLSIKNNTVTTTRKAYAKTFIRVFGRDSKDDMKRARFDARNPQFGCTLLN